MFQVTIILRKKGNKREILATFLYNEFQNAFTDVVTNSDSKIHATLDQLGYPVKTEKPDRIYSGGTKPNGYDDEFHFIYKSGGAEIVIVIGEIFVEDEE